QGAGDQPARVGHVLHPAGRVVYLAVDQHRVGPGRYAARADPGAATVGAGVHRGDQPVGRVVVRGDVRHPGVGAGGRAGQVAAGRLVVEAVPGGDQDRVAVAVVLRQRLAEDVVGAGHLDRI